MRTCRTFMSQNPMAATRGNTSPWGIARAIAMTLQGTSRPATRSWSTERSSFSSYKFNERPSAARRLGAAQAIVHEPDRGLFVAAAPARHSFDPRADRGRRALAATPAGGRVSRSVAAAGRGHHSMAGAHRRRGGAADHRAHRKGDERHSAADHHPFDLTVWLVRRHPHL